MRNSRKIGAAVTYVSRGDRLKKIAPTIIFLAVIYSLIVFWLYQSEYYLWIIIPAFLFLISLRNQIKYALTSEPEILEADEKAGKGLWKRFLLLFLVILIAALIVLLFDLPQIYMEVISMAAPALFFGYIIWRHFEFRKKARAVIAERKKRESQSA